MKVKLFWMPGCTHCDKMKKELQQLPRKLSKPVYIENKNISTEDRESLEAFPTLIFYSDDNRVLKVLKGFHPKKEILEAYEKVANLEHLQNKYKKMIDREIL